jgi:hypothetical protein
VTSLQSSDKVNGYNAASARNDTWAQFTNKMSAKAPTDFELIGWLDVLNIQAVSLMQTKSWLFTAHPRRFCLKSCDERTV